MEAGLQRLQRATDYAAETGVQLLLENLNREPERAEVNYLAHTVEECLYYFDAIQSPALAWSFTVNHATLVPEGIPGFLDRMPTGRLQAVRLPDHNGDYETHIYPGAVIIACTATIHRI